MLAFENVRSDNRFMSEVIVTAIKSCVEKKLKGKKGKRGVLQ